MAQPSVIFNGTPYDFFGFMQGLWAEVYLGFNQENFLLECYTVASKDFEENISDIPFAPVIPYMPQRPNIPRKRTVSKEVHVTPEENSSIVYAQFHGSNAPLVFGFITAQKLPAEKSKLILNFNYAIPIFKNFWDIAILKMQTEGWIASQPIEPLDEPASSDLEEWFEYRKRSKFRVTLRYIAEKTDYSYGYVRRKHSEFMGEKGNL